MNNINISLFIPCYENFNSFKKSFSSAINQKSKPEQIIIIDSSNSDNIREYIQKNNYENLSIEIIYHHEKNLYPGKARNIGVKISQCNWIAFLDSKTIASENWLSEYKKLILKKNYDVIFGSTMFVSKKENKISTLFLNATYGNKPHCTVPGTLIKKNYFEQNKFLENFRSGEDVLWRKKIINNHLINKLILDKKFYITYDQISNKFSENIYKHFIYSIYSSTIAIKNNIKDIYLSIFLILTALIIPKWNVLIEGWDTNPLYIPNITKLYILTLVSILIIYVLFKNILNFKIFKEIFLIKIILAILFIFFSIFIIRWNEVYSLIYYNAIFKLPHITKIYLFSIVLVSIIYRGVYVPLANNVKLSKLMYFEWIKIGIFGLCIDIVKSPGLIFGSVVSVFKLEFLFNLKEKNHEKKMLIVCPFPHDVQAGQRLKYEQHLKFFYLNGYSITLSSFISIKTWNIIYKKGFYLRKSFALIKGYLLRLLGLLSLRKYDAVYIFMWVVPYTSSIVEIMYRKVAKKIIYDMEDNILIIPKNEINPITSSFKSVKKYQYLISSADQVIVSSKYMENICNKLNNKNNSNYICASINLNRYNQITKKNKPTINIGWTGTFSTKKYLKIIEPVIQDISKIRNINFIVIGDFDYNLEGVKVQNIIWNKSREISDLNKIDIGIYPLFEDEWVLGKSGLKALQYMALGIPTVATNYGNIKNIITNNLNGYLVNNREEWIRILTKLCDDIDLRNYVGKNGRKHIEKFYSVDAISKKYLNVINNL